MRSLLTLSVLFFLVSSGFAQSSLNFKNKEITLKNLKADDEPTQVIYKFKNTGDQPVIITRISPMTSQLKAEWDRAPIAPGKSGEIKISFNSTQMPSEFNYGISLYMNNGNRDQLRLTANIVDNPAKPQLLYRFDMSGLKLKNNYIQFDKVFNWQKVSDTIYFFNGRPDTVTVGAYYIPSYMTLSVEPQKVLPGQKGTMILTFDAPQKNDFGYTYESLLLSINNSKDYKNRLSITANSVEDFGKLNKKELENAPVATFDKKEVNFGDIKPGEKAVCDFTLKNTGKRDLIVRKTRASCGCTAVTIGQNTIAPGESIVIRATFDSQGKSGRQNKSITVITNDPQTPEQIIYINGNILSK